MTAARQSLIAPMIWRQPACPRSSRGLLAAVTSRVARFIVDARQNAQFCSAGTLEEREFVRIRSAHAAFGFACVMLFGAARWRWPGRV